MSHRNVPHNCPHFSRRAIHNAKGTQIKIKWCNNFYWPCRPTKCNLYAAMAAKETQTTNSGEGRKE